MDKRFRIAFSFSGDKRLFVGQVADILAKRFGQDQILYDKYHEAEFAQSDLAFHLSNLYHNHTELVVAILCDSYEDKEWCGLEWNAIYGLVKKNQSKQVMLCRFDGVEGKGLHGLAGFLDLDNRTPEEVANLIAERLAINQGHPKNYYTLHNQTGPDRPITVQPVERSVASASGIRVLLVDDHEVIRAGTRVLLGQDHRVTVVGEAGTMVDAVQQAQQLKPDVILMDTSLPDGSGVVACKEILEILPNTRVIFMTSNADDDSVLGAVLVGAHGYVLKEIDSSALLEAVRSVAQGQSVLDSGVTERALQWLRGLHHQETPTVGQLAPQEEQLIALVATGRTNKEIATALRISIKLAKNQLANTFQKLCILRRMGAVSFSNPDKT